MNRPSGSTATVTTLVSSALANHDGLAEGLEVWPESHWPGFALREADVFKTYMAWWCM